MNIEGKIFFFIIHHSLWVSNMVPARNNNGEIDIFIDFKNINKALDKYNYLVPTVEHIL